MPNPIEFLLAEAQAHKIVLDKTSPHEKRKLVPIHTAKQFNVLLDKIKAEAPESEPHLPKRIVGGTSHEARMNQLTSVNYTDLEISVEIVLGVLNLLKAGH